MLDCGATIIDSLNFDISYKECAVKMYINELIYDE